MNRAGSISGIQPPAGKNSLFRSGLLVVSLYTILSQGCVGRQKRWTSTFFRMDTVTDVTIVADTKRRHPDHREIKEVWASIDSLLGDWERRFSQSNPASEILALNNRTTDTVVVSPELAGMIASALAYGRLTGGGFDCTVLPVKELWGLGETGAHTVVPAHDTLQKVLSCVDFRKVHVDTVKKIVYIEDRATRLDLGGIAKGAALQKVATLLEMRGIVNFLVCAGGDIFVKGTRQNAQPWRIAIQHPRVSQTFLAMLDLEGGAVVTSGDYERYWMDGNRRVHHIFDPGTGHSCTRNQSVTIAGSDPVMTDILSTGLFCRPADSIVAFINTLTDVHCLVVDSCGQIRISDGWKHRVRIL